MKDLNRDPLWPMPINFLGGWFSRQKYVISNGLFLVRPKTKGAARV